MTRFRIVAVLLLLPLSATAAGADYIISSRTAHAAPGEPLELVLTITNDESEPLPVEVPAPLHVRLETAAAVSTLEFVPERSGQLTVASHGFLRLRLNGNLPAEVQGPVTLTPTGFETNSLVVRVDSARPADAALAQAPAEQAAEQAVEPGPAPASTSASLIDKPPPLAVSVYEPVYFLVGGDGGLNAKFQISFRYRLFDDQGRLARKLPWIDDLYLSFSQTSLWDLNELSKPFRDSSYRPRLFYANHDLARFFDGRLRFGVESGFGHESNGKDGAQSRSFNMAYLRPTLTYGEPDGLRFFAGPLIHNYLANDENPDLEHYRGYVDWLFGVGSKGGLDFWTTLRKGTRSNYGSVEINLSYPLSKLSGGDLTGWLMLQYFGGYGESLLDYRRKLDAQWRLGIAVAL